MLNVRLNQAGMGVLNILYSYIVIAIPSHFESFGISVLFFVKFPEIKEFFPEFLCTQLFCFKTADDRQKIDGFVRRGVRAGFCRGDALTVSQLVSESDEKLFRNILYNENHVLYKLLPES